MQIRWKLTIGAALVVLSAVSASTYGFVKDLKDLSLEQSKRNIETTLSLFVRSVRDPVMSFDFATIEDIVATLGSQESLAYAAVYDSSGREISSVGDPMTLGKDASAISGGRLIVTETRFQGTAEVVGPNGSIGSVRVDVSTEAIAHKTAAIIERAVWWAIGVTLVAASVSTLFSRHMLRGLERLQDYAERIAGGDVGAKIDHDSDDEIGVLTRCFNRMSQAVATEQNALVVQANTDALTGIANRKGLTTMAKRIISVSEDNWYVIHLDLDGFKGINDSRGHEAGDAVLIKTSERLQRLVANDGMVGRFGGDEFVVVSRESSSQAILAFAGKLIAELSRPIHVDEDTLYVGVSAGIAKIERKTERPLVGNAIANADIALHTSKVSGKGIATMFDREMRVSVEESVRLIEDAHVGVTRGEFVPYLQPQVCLRTGRILGFECLMRWNHPRAGVLSPEQFLPVLKDGVLLNGIDWAVRDGACRWLADMLANGHLSDQVTIGFNFTQTQLKDKQTPERLHDLVFQYGLQPCNIAVEILETVIHDRGEDAVNQTLRELEEIGFSIELDDFGTGYSSLEKLVSLSVDRIKIDRSFVEGAHEAGTSKLILETIIGIGRTLHIDVLVEGAETQADIDLLKRMGCPAVQGHALCPALPRNDVSAWIRDFKAA